MKISKRQLRRIVKEERVKLNEASGDDELALVEEIVDLLIARGAIRDRGGLDGQGRMTYGWAEDYLRDIVIPVLRTL